MKYIAQHLNPESEYYVYSPSKTAMDVFFYPLECGHYIYESGFSLTREAFDNLLLMYIQAGSLTLEYNGKTTTVNAEQFVFIDCNNLHSYYTDCGWECMWCHFDGVLARSWYNIIISRLGNVFSLPNPYPTFSKLSAIFNTFDSGTQIHEPLLSKNLSDIMTTFLLYTPLKVNSPNYSGIIEEIMTYINQNFASDISVEALAELACLSQYHFIRIFKKETGFTPHEYIVNTRISTAKYLLRNSQLSVKDICFQVGFSCESVFCTAFKHYQGITPLQYRTQEKI